MLSACPLCAISDRSVEVHGSAYQYSAPTEFQRVASPPGRPKNFMSLRAKEAAPPSRTVTLAPRKNPREVALVDKAAELGNVGEFPARVPQKFFGAFDALFGQPPVGRHARRLLESPRKVAGR